MTLSWIPKPPERAARIASEAAQRVQVDEESLRPAVRELMRTRPDDFIWIAAEESALSLLRDSWTDELSDEIARALGAVHGQRLAEAESVPGQRYAVVLQADELLALSTVIVAPTSTSALAASFRPEIEVRGKPTRLLVDQLRAVDRTRLGRAAGTLSRPELERVDDALEAVLGLF